MKKQLYALILFSMLVGIQGYSQIKLDVCQQKAKNNFPMIVQYGLLESSKEYKLENANRSYLPQLTLSAKATYQSEVTEMPVSIPGVSPLSKDQYNAVIQLDQTIWDGGLTSSLKKGVNAQAVLDKNKLDVDLYSLRERVNQLFFGIILFNEQLKQIDLLKTDLERSYKQVSVYKENGMANQSDIDAIKVEKINALQKETELTAGREAFVKMLSVMIGEEIGDDEIFEKPSDLSFSNENRRPELNFFDAQKDLLDSQSQMIYAKNRMKLGAFLQGGYGKPGLNMLKNEFSPFYVAGVKLTWSLGNLYTKKNELKIIDLSKEAIESQRNVFLFNSNLKSTQQKTAINKTRTLMERDRELISLREGIMKAAEVKLQNGTISVSELLREINLLDVARNKKAIHEVELIMAIYELKNTINN